MENRQSREQKTTRAMSIAVYCYGMQQHIREYLYLWKLGNAKPAEKIAPPPPLQITLLKKTYLVGPAKSIIVPDLKRNGTKDRF